MVWTTGKSGKHENKILSSRHIYWLPENLSFSQEGLLSFISLYWNLNLCEKTAVSHFTIVADSSRWEAEKSLEMSITVAVNPAEVLTWFLSSVCALTWCPSSVRAPTELPLASEADSHYFPLWYVRIFYGMPKLRFIMSRKASLGHSKWFH